MPLGDLPVASLVRPRILRLIYGPALTRNLCYSTALRSQVKGKPSSNLHTHCHGKIHGELSVGTLSFKKRTIVQIRTLKTSPTTRLWGNSDGSPTRLFYRGQGTFGRIWSILPQPVKSLALITLSAAAVVILAPGLIILLGPPLIMGAWYFRRTLKRAQELLNKERWSNMASYHLFKDDGRGTETISFSAKTRIYDALIENEQGLGDKLHVDPETVEYTPIESLSQDFKASASGFMESMQIQQFGVLSGGNRIATATVVIFQDRSGVDGKRMRIELEPAHSNKTFVLNAEASKGENVIIDIKK